MSIKIIIVKVTIIIIPIEGVIFGRVVYRQLRMAGRGWSTVLHERQLFGSDVLAVVRLAVELEGHLNIVCSYQKQAARTWAPVVVK